MKSQDLKIWLKANKITREELARQCRVSKRTVDGWFVRDEIPEPAGCLIEKIMFDSIKLSLTFDEINEIIEQMNALNFKSIEDFVLAAIREKLKSRKNNCAHNLNVPYVARRSEKQRQ